MNALLVHEIQDVPNLREGIRLHRISKNSYRHVYQLLRLQKYCFFLIYASFLIIFRKTRQIFAYMQNYYYLCAVFLKEVMTKLSVNINKVATLRNARGGNMPDVERFAVDCELFGAQGITVHPRPDERHIRKEDVYQLKSMVTTELNPRQIKCRCLNA